MAKCKAESIRNEVMNGLVKDRSDLKDTKVKLQRIGEIVFKLAKAELMSKVQDNKIDKALAERLDTLRMSKIEKTAGTIEKETIKNAVPKTNKYEVDATKMVDRRGSGSTLTNHTGGAYGADGIWADMLRPHKVTNNHYQPVGTNSGNKRVQGLAKNGDRVINVTASEDAEGRKLNNKLGNSTHGMNNRNLVQVYNADKVFAVAPIENGKVTGGTGSAVRMADTLGKEVYVLDTTTVKWFQIKDGKATEIDYRPKIEGNFAAIGTRKIEQYPVQDKATGKWVKSELLPNSKEIVAEMNRTVVNSFNSNEHTLNIGGLSIPYESVPAGSISSLASTNARTGRIRIQEGLTAVKVAEYLLNNEEVEGSSEKTKSKTRETRGTVVGLLNRKYGINIMEVLRAMQGNDQLLRSFLLLHEYRHTLQLEKSGSKEAFMEAYNEDPVKFELDADLFALNALKSEVGLLRDMTKEAFRLTKAGYTIGKSKPTEPTKSTNEDTKPKQSTTDEKNISTKLSNSFDSKVQDVIDNLTLSLDNFTYTDYSEELAGMNKRQVTATVQRIEAEQEKRRYLLNDYTKIEDYAEGRTDTPEAMIEIAATNYKNNIERLSAYKKYLEAMPDDKINKIAGWTDVSESSKQKDDTMSSSIVDRTTNNITKEALECANGM